MGTPKTYLHIGQPKCASTSLQREFFANHAEIHHLGAAFNGITGRYIDRDVTRAVESDLRFKKAFLWQPERVAAVFGQHLQAAATMPGVRAVGLSCEFLGFTLGNEIDVVEKARRCAQVLGKDTCVIIIIREQMALLESLYRELIKGGYAGSYKNFLEYTYLYQDRNWCLDFCYDRLLDCYQGLFGRENVLMLPLEKLQADEAGFMARICSVLGLSQPAAPLKARNVAADPAELELLRRFNEKWPHELGGAFFSPFQSSRLQAWFEDELGVRVPHERGIDDYMRGPLGEIARDKLADGHVPPLDMEAPAALAERLGALYGRSNQRLTDMLDCDLEAFGYRLG